MPGDSQSNAADEQRIAEKEFYGLRCNFSDNKCKSCNHSVKEAWVTSCSHLVCYPHAKEWFSTHKECPVCRNGPVKVVRFNLGATRQERKPVVGMTPPELIQAAESALSFWVNQKVYQFQMADARNKALGESYKKVEETIRTRLKEAETVCNKSESENQKLQRMLKAAVDDNSKASEEVAGLERQVKEAESQFRCLQRLSLTAAKEKGSTPQAQCPAQLWCASSADSWDRRSRLPHPPGDRSALSYGGISRVVAAPTASSDVGCALFLGMQSRPGSDSNPRGALPCFGGLSGISSDMHTPSWTPGVVAGNHMFKKRKIT